MRDEPDKYDYTHIETLMTYAKTNPRARPMPVKTPVLTPGKRGC